MTKEVRDNGLSTWNSKVIESNGIYQILIPTSYFCGVSASWLLGMSLTSDFLLSPVVLGGTFMDFPGLEAGPLGLATFLGGLLLSCMYWEGVFFTSSGFLGTFLTPPRLGGSFFVSLVFLGLFSLASLSFFKVSMVDVSLGWIILLYLETLKLPVASWPWNWWFSETFQVWV